MVTIVMQSKHRLYLCLPLRETYIVFPSVYVRPSVRLSVTLSLSEPYLQEPFVQKKIAKNSENNIVTEVVQQKNKIQFCQKNGSFGQKTTF